MTKKLITLSKYFLLNLILFLVIISSIITLDHEQKNNIANATISLIRENFLVTDFRTVARDIEKVKSDNFSKISIYDKNNNLIINSSEIENLINVKINKSIWSDREAKHLKGKVTFFVGCDHLFVIAFKILFGTFFITAPVFVLANNFLSKRQLQLIEVERNKILTKITMQMSHDIRSPIAALQHLAEKVNEFTADDILLLKSSLERIDKIANIHLNESKGTFFQNVVENNLSILIVELVNEKKVEFPNVNFELSLQDSSIFCDSSDFKRILSNLVNNSVEAIKNPHPIVKISIIKLENRIVIKIEDNGQGIDKNILTKLGNISITTKRQGNGLGLKHAIETLAEWNSNLKITSTGREGTTIEISFPEIEKSFVLIDDDELTRTTWKMKADKTGIDLKTFNSIETFNLNRNLISKDTWIYIDSELGNGVKGELIAESLFQEGYINISLATGYSSDTFSELKFLKSVISKKAPF